MNFLGIDYGDKRIGLSFGDELGLAVPLPAAVKPSQRERMASIEHVIRERKIDALVVGYPYNMDGTVGFKAKEVDRFIETLVARFRLPVHRVDERLTSHQAAAQMRAAAGKQKKRSPQAQQNARRTGELDSRAAALILQDFLDASQDGEVAYVD